jgi:thymidine phosphorylase
MPHAQIKTKQAKLTLLQLHAELAGKVLDNKKEAKRLHAAMIHVEAVIKMLDPAHNLRTIAVRRRKPNQWFKRGTVWRAVLDAMRRADTPLTVSEIATQMLEAKRIKDAPRSAVVNLEGSVRAALKFRDGIAVVSEGDPIRWQLKSVT